MDDQLPFLDAPLENIVTPLPTKPKTPSKLKAVPKDNPSPEPKTIPKTKATPKSDKVQDLVTPPDSSPKVPAKPKKPPKAISVVNPIEAPPVSLESPVDVTPVDDIYRLSPQLVDGKKIAQYKVALVSEGASILIAHTCEVNYTQGVWSVQGGRLDRRESAVLVQPACTLTLWLIGLGKEIKVKVEDVTLAQVGGVLVLPYIMGTIEAPQIDSPGYTSPRVFQDLLGTETSLSSTPPSLIGALPVGLY